MNSGAYDPESPSAHEAPLLSPAELNQALTEGTPLAPDVQVLIGDVEVGIFEYLASTMQWDTCLSAAGQRPLPAWLQPKADRRGKHPLHWAVILPDFDDERVEVVGALLESRADPNCRDSDTFGLRIAGVPNRDLASKCGGKTPLHHLCGSVRESPHTLQAIALLLRHGADAEVRDFDDNTAVQLAQMRQNHQTVEALKGEPVGTSEASERKEAYARRCTEREEAWEQQRRQAKVLKREAYAARLAAEYVARHPPLYTLSDAEYFFEPSFLTAVHVGTREAFSEIRDFRRLSDGLYQYRIFRPEVCDHLMQEVDHFNAFAAESGIGVTRPNSMNRYGLILNDIGFLGTMHALVQRYVQPLAAAFFSDQLGEGFTFASQHSFIVRYKIGEDLDLKTHRDDSDLTLNVCLGKTFEGARLYFHRDTGSQCPCGTTAQDVAAEFAYPHPPDCRFCTLHYDHCPGVGLMHMGRHVHGVERLQSGERSNLILWCRTRNYPEELAAELEASLVCRKGPAVD